MHVTTEQATLDAQPGSTDDGMGYVDGHGVITGEQVRDIASRDDVIIKYFPGPPTKGQAGQAEPEPAAEPAFEPEPQAETESDPEPELDLDLNGQHQDPQPPPQPEQEPESATHAEPPDCYRRRRKLPLPCLPSDPYRFSTAFDTYIRARGLACDVPGCDRPAFAAQLDHVQEFNHDNPADGGQTESGNVHPLCVFHHLLKTGDHGWLDDMTTDPDGRVHYRIRTPEGLWIDGPDLHGNDLFDTLNRIRFANPPTAPANPASAAAKRSHRTATTADKQRRRQREREANRIERETTEATQAAAKAAAEAAAEQQRIERELFKYWRLRFPTANPARNTSHIEPIDDDGAPPF